MGNYNRIKRTILFLITLSLILASGLFLSGSLKYAYGGVITADGNYNFNVVDGQAYLYQYNGSETNVVIPETVTDGSNTYTVEGIISLFRGNTNITSVTIPNSVTSLGNGCFSGCAFEEIIIPDSITSIPASCFETCYNLNNVIIPNSVTALGANSFRRCTALTDIAIPNSVAEIGTGSFSYCSELVTITIPDAITKIEDYLFYDCDSLQNIMIPKSVTALGNRSFGNCAQLNDILLPNSLTAIGDACFIECPGLTKLTIPDNVATLGYSCFELSTNLSEINLPESVVQIGPRCFYGCSSLTDIPMLGSIKTIPDECFYSCAGLVDIQIPEGISSIGNKSFMYCMNLESIEIPGTVTKLGERCFAGCDNLSNVVIGEGLQELGDNCFAQCINLSEINLPISLKTIGEFCFHSSALTHVRIPTGVTSVSKGCFYNCDMLTSVEMSDSITHIGDYCFESCGQLTSIVLSENLTAISWDCFSGCTLLKEITIPDGVTSLGFSSFQGCRALTSINIPNGVTDIGTSCFQNCDSLSTVTIPNIVKTIGRSCFSGCTSLEKSYFIGNAPTLGPNAFSNCNANFSVYYLNSATGYSNPWMGYPAQSFTPSITFDSQGGSAVPAQVTEYGTLGIQPTPPAKTGYQFSGWYLDVLCMTAWDFTSDRVESEITLYAKWIPNNYTVNFNANGGSGTMAQMPMTYDVSKTLNPNAFNKTGYTFAGWATSPTGAVEYVNLTTVKNLTTTSDGAITLYAKWTPNNYTVKFSANGGTGTMTQMAMTYDVTKTLTINAFKRTGYSFLGWATSSTGSAINKDAAAVKNLTTTNGATVTLYAKWGGPITSAVSYNYNSIKISWTAAGGATSYRVYRATSAGGTYTLVKTLTSGYRSWIDTGRITGRYYYYKVYPMVGTKAYVHSTYKYARAIPTTPTISATKYTSTSIKVSWSGIGGATRYQIYRATSPTGTYSLVYTASSTLRSWVNTSRTPGVTYYYKVRAYHLEGSTYVYGAFSAVKSLKL